MDVLARNNVRVSGRPDGPPIAFMHGYGCDQNMWRLVTPTFEASHRIVLFDHVGAGGSDLSKYEVDKYADLHGYAGDVLDICQALGLEDVVLVGHSVSAMIGVLVAIREPGLVSRLVLVGPSPCYIDQTGYTGGFSSADIDDLLSSLDSNYLGWSAAMAPVIIGNPERPALGEELTNSFCRTDPTIARHFARATFTSDNRGDLAAVTVPTLILQCSEDVIAPAVVGAYVHEAIVGSTLVTLAATGHVPQLSAPGETSVAIAAFLAER